MEPRWPLLVPDGRLVTQFERWLPDAGQYLTAVEAGQTDKRTVQRERKQKTPDLFGPNDLIIGKIILLVPNISTQVMTASPGCHVNSAQRR